MKNKVEIKYVSDDSGYWELTVNNKFIGQQIIKLDPSNAMLIAMAIATVRDIGIQEGYDKAKKKYKAIEDASSLDVSWKPGHPWDDADIPMHWNPAWKLNDPSK